MNFMGNGTSLERRWQNRASLGSAARSSKGQQPLRRVLGGNGGLPKRERHLQGRWRWRSLASGGLLREGHGLELGAVQPNRPSRGWKAKSRPGRDRPPLLTNGLQMDDQRWKVSALGRPAVAAPSRACSPTRSTRAIEGSAKLATRELNSIMLSEIEFCVNIQFLQPRNVTKQPLGGWLRQSDGDFERSPVTTKSRLCWFHLTGKNSHLNSCVQLDSRRSSSRLTG